MMGSKLLVHIESPRAKLGTIHLEDGQLVQANDPDSGIDVPAIGEPLHLAHHEVPVHQGPKPRDRPAAVAASR